jgi:hypothetical protein
VVATAGLVNDEVDAGELDALHDRRGTRETPAQFVGQLSGFDGPLNRPDRARSRAGWQQTIHSSGWQQTIHLVSRSRDASPRGRCRDWQ